MITPRQLFDPLQLGVAASILYTAPVNTRCRIINLTFSNTTGAAVTVTVYLVKSGGAAGDANTIRKDKTVGPLDTWQCYEANHIIHAGDTIRALASAATSITAMGSGLEVTP